MGQRRLHRRYPPGQGHPARTRAFRTTSPHIRRRAALLHGDDRRGRRDTAGPGFGPELWTTTAPRRARTRSASATAGEEPRGLTDVDGTFSSSPEEADLDERPRGRHAAGTRGRPSRGGTSSATESKPSVPRCISWSTPGGRTSSGGATARPPARSVSSGSRARPIFSDAGGPSTSSPMIARRAGSPGPATAPSQHATRQGRQARQEELKPRGFTTPARRSSSRRTTASVAPRSGDRRIADGTRLVRDIRPGQAGARSQPRLWFENVWMAGLGDQVLPR